MSADADRPDGRALDPVGSAPVPGPTRGVPAPAADLARDATVPGPDPAARGVPAPGLNPTAGAPAADAAPSPAHGAGAEAPEPPAPAGEPVPQPAAPVAEQAADAPAPTPAPPPDSTAPVPSPGHATVNVAGREGSHAQSGATSRLAWGARTDVGLVRDHNEDSYLVRAPVFAVCDGMGGHAAGEVASAIAVKTIAEHAPAHADDVQLGAAVEAANLAVMEAVATGAGLPGMGCTASAILVEDGHVAVAHVGDSRVYLLNAGTLVRLTHDHSYVEELVEAGEITADEARVHPSRSVITRALGSDADMYADHFGLDVTPGDRLIVCSDGLSSMVEDSEIEALAVSSPTPQAAADTLVAAALTAGGHDNVSVVVVDVIDDGAVARHRRSRLRAVAAVVAGGLLAVALLAVAGIALVRSSWYVGANGSTVGIYRGVKGELLGVPLSTLVETTSVEVADLPEAVQKTLADGVRVNSEDEAVATVDSYRAQIDADKSQAAATADRAGDAAAEAAADPAEEGVGDAEEASGEGAGEDDPEAPASEDAEAAGAEAAATPASLTSPADVAPAGRMTRTQGTFGSTDGPKRQETPVVDDPMQSRASAEAQQQSSNAPNSRIAAHFAVPHPSDGGSVAQAVTYNWRLLAFFAIRGAQTSPQAIAEAASPHAQPSLGGATSQGSVTDPQAAATRPSCAARGGAAC